jgi:hypothetical protein
MILQKFGFIPVEHDQYDEILNSIQRNTFYLSNQVNLICEFDFRLKSLLCVPYHINLNSCAITIRRKESFSSFDVNRLERIIPILLHSIDNWKFLHVHDFNLLPEKFKDILEVAEILNRILNLHQLVQTIIKWSCKLFNAEY